jgi:hypothetical protein
MKMLEKSKLQWWVPMSYQAEQARRDLSKIFSPAAIARIILAEVLVFAAVAFLLTQRIPDLQFDWLSAFLKCMGALFIILSMCCALAFIPPMVMVNAKGIAISQAQHCRRYPYAELAELRIEDTASPYPMLLLRMRSQSEPERYPISPRIMLDDLRALIDQYTPR